MAEFLQRWGSRTPEVTLGLPDEHVPERLDWPSDQNRPVRSDDQVLSFGSESSTRSASSTLVESFHDWAVSVPLPPQEHYLAAPIIRTLRAPFHWLQLSSVLKGRWVARKIRRFEQF